MITTKTQTNFSLVLRRDNGRYVKTLETTRSKYSAKRRRNFWEKRYDESYHVTIEMETK